MKRNASHVAALVIVAAIGFPSLAFGESAEELLADCKPIAEAKVTGDRAFFELSPETGQCWGAFTVLQGASVWIDSPHHRVLGACTPASAKRTELIAVFVEYVQQHPESRHEDFVDVAMRALQKAYPCQ
jgi:hypothetical protein